VYEYLVNGGEGDGVHLEVNGEEGDGGEDGTLTTS
jgi:hypothetical protein